MPDGEEVNGVQRIYPLDRFGLKLMSVGFFDRAPKPDYLARPNGRPKC